MKVWQKVYLAVLILVLFTVNLGLFFASGFLYRQNLSQEESQAETECYFLSRNLARDFERMQGFFGKMGTPWRLLPVCCRLLLKITPLSMKRS